MEENATNQPAPAKKNFGLPLALLGLIVIVAVAFFVTQGNNPTSTGAMTTSTPAPTAQQTLGEEQQSKYQDGVYAVIGNYVSPGGPREIDVTLTLENGVITDAVFVGKATDATSKRFQGEFGDNYQAQVVGKNIDEVSVTKVAGSSLTPKGFTDALEKVKEQAAKQS